MGAVQYRVCGSCRREFYSDEEYQSHACRKDSRNPNGDPRGVHAKAMGSGMLKDIAGDESKSKAVLEGVLAAGGNIDAGVLESHASVDMRLQAVQEMKRMKSELTKAGIPCNTLGEEQTRAEYEQHIQGGKSVVADKPKAANAKPSASAGKKASGGKK